MYCTSLPRIDLPLKQEEWNFLIHHSYYGMNWELEKCVILTLQGDKELSSVDVQHTLTLGAVLKEMKDILNVKFLSKEVGIITYKNGAEKYLLIGSSSEKFQ